MKLALSSTTPHNRHCNSWLRLGLLSSLFFSVRAPAQPAQTPAEVCVAQAERAQEFHRAGDVSKARAEVALCAREHCPELVRKDCEAWLEEWDEPTAPARESNETLEPAVKPFESTNPKVTTPWPAAPAEEQSQRASMPVWPWFTTAVGVAGFAGFTYWGLTGRRDAKQLADTCGRDKSCTRAEVDVLRNKLIFADTSLGVGVLACAASIVGFVVGASDPTPGDDETSHDTSRLAPRKPTVVFGGSSVTARFVF